MVLLQTKTVSGFGERIERIALSDAALSFAVVRCDSNLREVRMASRSIAIRGLRCDSVVVKHIVDIRRPQAVRG